MGAPGARAHRRACQRRRAAARLLPDPAAARLARNRSVHIVFVLPAGTNSFVMLLNQQVQALAPWLAEQRAVAAVQTVDVFSPPAIAQHLASLHGKFDAVVLMALDHPQVRAAIDDLVAHGSVVVTLVSDVPSSKRNHFVGIDNVAAGRTAATLLGRFVGPRPGRIGIVLGSLALRDHAERLFGFGQVMAASTRTCSNCRPSRATTSRSAPSRSWPSCSKREAELVGLYSIGAGNRGIQAALAASGARRMSSGSATS